jgi:shikimate kinase
LEQIIVHIIHIVGPIGAGKTMFIRKYLNNYPVFDIKGIYERYHISPTELYETGHYEQFSDILTHHLEKLIFHMEKLAMDVLVVESSGINRILNQIVNRHPHFLIWIHSDLDRFANNRPYYSPELNKRIRNAFNHRMVLADVVFDWTSKSYIKEPNSDLQALLTKNCTQSSADSLECFTMV